ncbi:MAG: YihY/virulence factor BrkB family protein [Gammaproteobacteria bacterium]|nr:YihY/virulence factor BrkB family protein [Gammaproteobacteria bacterium]
MKVLQKIEYYVWSVENPQRWQRALRVLIAVFRVVNQSRLKLFATSLTYGTLLAIVPLLAVLFTLLQSFGIDTVLQSILTDVLAPMGSSGNEIKEHLMTFVSNARTGLLGGIGLVFLFYSVFALFRKIEIALNHIWFVRSARSIKAQLLGYMGALMLVVIAASAAISFNLMFHQDQFLSVFGGSALITWLIGWGAKGLSIIMTALTLATVYSASINSKVKFRAAFAGGIFCALMWIPLTTGFAKLIATSSNYSLVYSSFAGLIILLIWLHILWVLFLSGALVTYFIQYPSLLKSYSSKRLNPAEQEYFAQKLMHIIIEYFENGKGVVNITCLIEKTGLNHQQILDLLAPFLLQNLIICVGESHDDYLLAVDQAKVTDDCIRTVTRGTVRGIAQS